MSRQPARELISRIWNGSADQQAPYIAYTVAVVLAVAAQLARLLLHAPTEVPFITYVPFMVLCAALGGLGPGSLTTVLCVLEAWYFAMEPVGSFQINDLHYGVGLGTLAGTGMVVSWIFDSKKRAWRKNFAVTAANVRIAAELASRQRMLESVLEHSPVAIAMLKGPEFIYSLVNPAYQALRPGEVLIGRTVAELWPALIPVVIPLLKTVRDGQVVRNVSGLAVPIARGDGLPQETRYFDFSYAPLPGSGHAESQVLVCALDMTERKRDEAALRAAYLQLAAIHAHAPVALLVIDQAMKVQQANEMAGRLAGRGIHDMLGLAVGDALGCTNAVAAEGGCGRGVNCGRCGVRRAILDTAIDRVNHEGIEAWVSLTANGRLQARCLSFSTTYMNHDDPGHVLICAEDITARKGTEVELEAQNDELLRQAELINLSHDAIITTDSDLVIRTWNHGAEETYGWTEAEAVGQIIHILLPSKEPFSLALLDETPARKRQWEGEIEHRRRDGKAIRVDSRLVLIRNGAYSDARVLVINRDVTERRRAENALVETVRELESAVAEKTVLLQEVHHRVKNNLAVVVSLLRMKADDCGPEAALALAESQQRVHSIALLHEHLYNHDHLDRIDFAEYARQLAQGLYSAFDVGNPGRIALVFELEPIEVGVDRAIPCGLILNELLSNAFKYAFSDGRAGRIRISFSRPESEWFELTVEDDGVGLPAGSLGGQGKSLGLRIVSILAAQLDGTVEQRDCNGACIVLRFPAAA